MERYPQVMINVKISPRWKEAWKNIPEIEEIIEIKRKSWTAAAGYLSVKAEQSRLSEL